VVVKAATKTPAKAAKQTRVKITVWGSGELGEAAIKAELRDFISAHQDEDTDLSFVMYLPKGGVTPSLKVVGAYLMDEEIPFDLLTTEGGTTARGPLKVIAQNAQTAVECKRDPVARYVKALLDADEAYFLALYDEDDALLDVAMTKALEGGASVYNMLDAMSGFEIDDSPEDAPPATAKVEEEEDDDEEDAEVVPISKGKKLAAVPDETDDEEADEIDYDLIVARVIEQIGEVLTKFVSK
jgi:hypothetical protein